MKVYNLNDLNDIKTENIKMFIYGKAMTGKTTFASTFPKSIILSTDGNFKGLSKTTDAQAVLIGDREKKTTASGIEVEESGWVTFKTLVNHLIDKPDAHDRQTIVVDLARDIYDMCREHVLRGMGLTHETEDKARGRIWNYLDSEFKPVLRKLMTCDYNVIIIAHEKTLDLDGVETIVPELIRSVMNKIETYSDIVGRLTVTQSPGQPAVRVLEPIPFPRQISGNRLGMTKVISEPTYDKIINDIKQGDN